jgi:DNA sulfur modification protein DndB
MFADLNKHAVKPTKSLGILYDHRDSFAQFIVKLANALPIFYSKVELERTSISNRSTKFFTLNGISDATKSLLRPKSKNLSEQEQKIAVEFWDEVSKNIPEWQLLIDKKVTAWELRKEFVHAHTNLLNALGMVGHALITQFPDTWKQKLGGLQKIDWARDSQIWQGKLMLDGKMIKNRTGIKKAANIILQGCGTTKTLDEFEATY